MKRFFGELKNILEAGNDCELVIITEQNGSAPGKKGAKMLVRSDGSICGTIGGGSVEYEALQIASEAIRNKASFCRRFELNTENGGMMVCGGSINVVFSYMDPENAELLQSIIRICNALDLNEEIWLTMKLEGDFSINVYDTLNENNTDSTENSRYSEKLTAQGLVYVFGCGHVAKELVPLIAHLGFRVTVMDDREEFANKSSFPDAAQIIVGDFNRTEDYISINHDDYVVIMTRSHEYDYVVLRQILSREPYYVGIMGSRRKVGFIQESLRNDGFSQKDIDSCHMPIGVAIKAASPAEIAVSVAAELIKERAEKDKQQ